MARELPVSEIVYNSPDPHEARADHEDHWSRLGSTSVSVYCGRDARGPRVGARSAYNEVISVSQGDR